MATNLCVKDSTGSIVPTDSAEINRREPNFSTTATSSFP